jgi:bifunctional DNA-binding transcriptional regulator/antitoxin component of YhaV-PrlF toxin-antitoxin module
MPQLLKGGKYTYAWVTISDTGSIAVPPETVEDYGLELDELIVLLSGSNSSGWFSVIPKRNLTNSPLNPLKENKDMLEDKVQLSRGRPFAVTRFKGDGIYLMKEVLEVFGLEKGDRLLVIRGSGMGPSFIVRGSVIEEALKHPELVEF